jgi:2-amino-4-hydroxy-6-hydroxymethyldihydropteridine diphosphokinase
MTHRVYLALGSNLGDRQENLRQAVEGIKGFAEVVGLSAVYETEPWGIEDQPHFLNQAAEIETELAPVELLAALKLLERRMGRRGGVRYGPRQIDLDILFYDEETLRLPELEIPHPRLHERAFVLVPLADLAPGLVHPHLGLTVQQMLGQVDRSGVKQADR